MNLAARKTIEPERLVRANYEDNDVKKGLTMNAS